MVQMKGVEEIESMESHFPLMPIEEAIKRFFPALSDFKPPKDKNLERPPRMFSKCPVPEIDEYFEYIAKIGRPLFKWEVIRPAFLWKLEQTISEMVCVETELAVSEEDRKLLISDDELREQRQFIIQKGTEFDGTPFTFQRLCELLTSPTRHYKRASKYLRALEKNINVVTTITENGERITGIETDAEDLDAVPCNRIEVPFFVQVDECDTPIETKMFATGSRLSRDNGTSTIVLNQHESKDNTPINLSSSRSSSEDLSRFAQKKTDGTTKADFPMSSVTDPGEILATRTEDMEIDNN